MPVSSYFIGFALVGGGLIIFMLAILLMAKRDTTLYRKQKATISRMQSRASRATTRRRINLHLTRFKSSNNGTIQLKMGAN